MVNILAAVLVGVVLPVAVVGALIGRFGASAMFIGLVWGALGAKLGGTRRMLYLTPAIGIAAGLGAGTAYGWWWVALLAALGVIAGSGIGFGWLPPLLMLPFAATFVTPLSSVENAVIFGGISAIGALYGVVIVRRFGAPTVVEGERQPPPVAAGVAIVFGVVLGSAAAIGVALGWTEPYGTRADPRPDALHPPREARTDTGEGDRYRAWGHGCDTGGDPRAAPEVIALIATVALLLALTQLKTYWLYYGLYTFAIVFALAAPAHVASEAKERGFEILAGIALLVLGLAVIHALATRLSKHDPQPELAPLR
jgi:MFS family permease